MTILQTLGWVLVHSVWQLAALALLFGLARRALRRAESRYALAAAALALMALAPLATAALLTARPPAAPSSALLPAPTILPPLAPPAPDNTAPIHPLPPPEHPRPAASPLAPPPISPPSAIWRTAAAHTFSAALPYLSLAYLLGVLALSLRMLLGYRRVRALVSLADPLDPPWPTRARDLARRLAVTRPVRLLRSALIEVPCVVGALRPVILVPLAALCELPAPHLEALLAHELAHVRRHDYLVNIIQFVLETLLFYHPAVWWVSAQMRQEREHACDTLAAAACGNRLTYARALEAMERLRPASIPLAPAAAGGHLLPRIRRVLDPAESPTPTASTRLIAGGLVLALVVGMAIGLYWPMRAGAATTQSAMHPPDRPALVRDLAARVVDKNWAVRTAAITEAAKLVASQPAGADMGDFQALVGPLFAQANWGGEAEREGRLAADTLVRIGPLAVPTLVAKLQSTESHDRWSAMVILGRMGEPKAVLFSSARGLLHDPDSYVRRTAIEVLGRMGRDALAAVPDLQQQGAVEKQLLDRQNRNQEYEFNQVWVDVALIRIQGANSARIAALAKHLESEDKNSEPSYAATVLGELGSAARSAAPELQAALRHKSGQVRVNAAAALGKIGADDAGVIAALIEQLKNDPEAYAREAAASTLGRLGPKAKAALPALREAVKNGTQWWGWQDAIQRIEAPGPATVPATMGAADRAELLKGDLGSFSLALGFRGGRDGRSYDLHLSVRREPAVPDVDTASYVYHHAQVTAEQARKIVDHLAKEGYLEHAAVVPNMSVSGPLPQGPRCVLNVARASGPVGAEGRYTEDLGWNLQMLHRLDGLRKVLDGAPAAEMDQFLAALDPPRKEWEKAAATRSAQGDPRPMTDVAREVVDGLRADMAGLEKDFPALAGIAKMDVKKEGEGLWLQFAKNATPPSKVAPVQAVDPAQPFCRLYVAVWPFKGDPMAGELEPAERCLTAGGKSRHTACALGESGWIATLALDTDDEKLAARVNGMMNAALKRLLEASRGGALAIKAAEQTQAAPFDAAVLARGYEERIKAVLPKGWTVQPDGNILVIHRPGALEYYPTINLPMHNGIADLRRMGFVHSGEYEIRLELAPPMTAAEAKRLADDNPRIEAEWYRTHRNWQGMGVPPDLTAQLHRIPDWLAPDCSVFVRPNIGWDSAFVDDAARQECAAVKITVGALFTVARLQGPGNLPAVPVDDLKKALIAALGPSFEYLGGEAQSPAGQPVQFWLARVRPKEAGEFQLSHTEALDYPAEAKKLGATPTARVYRLLFKVGDRGAPRIVVPWANPAYPQVNVGDTLIIPVHVDKYSDSHSFSLQNTTDPGVANLFKLYDGWGHEYYLNQGAKEPVVRNDAGAWLELLSSSNSGCPDHLGRNVFHHLTAYLEFKQAGNIRVAGRLADDPKPGPAREYRVVPKDQPVTVQAEHFSYDDQAGKTISSSSGDVRGGTPEVRVGDRLVLECAGYVTPAHDDNAPGRMGVVTAQEIKP